MMGVNKAFCVILTYSFYIYTSATEIKKSTMPDMFGFILCESINYDMAADTNKDI